MREFSDEDVAKMEDTAKWLHGFFQDGIVAWSIWTKEYMSEAEQRMFDLIRIIDPTSPTREEIFNYWQQNQTVILPPDPLPDWFTRENTGGGGGGIEQINIAEGEPNE